MTKRRYYEAMSIVQYILEGHNKAEAGKEFDLKPQLIDKKLKSIGYTYAEIVEQRELKKKQGS